MEDPQNQDKQSSTPNNRRLVVTWLIRIVVIFVLVVACVGSVYALLIYRSKRHYKKRNVHGQMVQPFLVKPTRPLQVYDTKDKVVTRLEDEKDRQFYQDGQLETFGLDLSRLNPGDLILEHAMSGDEKDDELELLNTTIFPNQQYFKRSWSAPDSMRRKLQRLKPFSRTVGHGSQIIAKGAPSHPLVVLSVKRDENGAVFSPDDVIVIEHSSRNHCELISLTEYFKRNTCTQRRFWVLHMGGYEKVPLQQAATWLNGFLRSDNAPTFSYVEFLRFATRTFGIDVGDREQFYACARAQCNQNNASTLSRQIGWYATVENDTIRDWRSPSMTLDPSVYQHATGLFKGLANWRGLDELSSLTCSAACYSILEQLGMVLPLSDTSVGNLKQTQSVPLSLSQILARRQTTTACVTSMRILNPRTIVASDFLRTDFQWNDGIFVQRASRFWYHYKTPK